MPKATAAKARRRSEEEILDQATRQLLNAAKEQAKKQKTVSPQSKKSC
jgi:hypothetical protein